ncbi:hypothetical protein H4R34_004919, partial [Dimargaris verticillata]
APFSYDIRVSGDISPYNENNDGRTTRVSVKITSSDDVFNILQARRAGGGVGRPVSIGSPRELLNVDVNARVNPMFDKELPPNRPRYPQSHNAHHSPVHVPVRSRPSSHASSPVPVPEAKRGGGQGSGRDGRMPLTITETATPSSDQEAMNRFFNRPPSAQSRTELAEVMARTANRSFESPVGQSPAETPLPPPSECELDEVLRRTAAMSNASMVTTRQGMSKSPPVDLASRSVLDMVNLFNHRRGGRVTSRQGSATGSALDDSGISSHAYPFTKRSDDFEMSHAVVPIRSISPPPSLGRSFASLLPPEANFARQESVARSCSPPTPLQRAWLCGSKAGGSVAHEIYSAMRSPQASSAKGARDSPYVTSAHASPAAHPYTQTHFPHTPTFNYGSPRPSSSAKSVTTQSVYASSAPGSRETSFVNVTTMTNGLNNSSSFLIYDEPRRVQIAQVQTEPVNCFEVCHLCNQLIERADRVVPQDRPIHRHCLKCTVCGEQLTVDNFATLEDAFYCQTHYVTRQRFISSIAPPDLELPSNGGQSALLSYHPAPVEYSVAESRRDEASPAGDFHSHDVSVVCACTCSCLYCPFGLYGVAPSVGTANHDRCDCVCACPVCVRARAIHSRMGTPPSSTPAFDKSIIPYPTISDPTPFSTQSMAGGDNTTSSRDPTPNHSFNRSTIHEKACTCHCYCSFCPLALYGLASVIDDNSPQPCHCSCTCSICMRANSIYESYGAPPPLRPKTPAGCRNPGADIPCLLETKEALGDASVLECGCGPCRDQRALDATMIENIMAYYYTKAVTDASFILSPRDPRYIRVICPCCRCRKYRMANFSGTGSPQASPQPSIVLSPAAKPNDSPIHRALRGGSQASSRGGHTITLLKTPEVKPVTANSSAHPAPATATPPSGPKSGHFGKCPCPSCQMPCAAPASAGPPSQPPNPPKSHKTPPPPSPPPSGAKAGDFGKCPCPNCQTASPAPAAKGGPHSRPPISPPAPPTPPAGPKPVDFGKCPCPNCQTADTGSGSKGGPPKTPPPPSSPPFPPKPPGDFGRCPCPNCSTSAGPGNAGKPPPKPPASPPAKPPSNGPPKDFGVCPCPNCQTAMSFNAAQGSGKPPSGPPKSPPASGKPSNENRCPCPNCHVVLTGPAQLPKPASPPRAPSPPASPPKPPSGAAKGNESPHAFNCPCPNCLYYARKPSSSDKSPRPAATGSKQGGTAGHAGSSCVASAASNNDTCTCTCPCALCALSPKYDLQVQVSVETDDPKSGGNCCSPTVVTKEIHDAPCRCVCICACCTRARKFCDPNASSMDVTCPTQRHVAVDVGADGKANIIVNGNLDEKRKRHTEEFRTRSPRGSEWLTERIYDNYVRTVIEERQRRLNSPKAVSPMPQSTVANGNRGGRALHNPMVPSPLTLSLVEPPQPEEYPHRRSLDASMVSECRSDSSLDSGSRSPLSPSARLKRKSAIRQGRACLSPTENRFNRSFFGASFDRSNEMVDGKNNWPHPKCPACNQICYMFDQVSFDGVFYHKQCLKCHQCRRVLSPANCMRVRDDLYCTNHGSILLRRRSMLIGPEASRPKPTKRRPPSVRKNRAYTTPSPNASVCSQCPCNEPFQQPGAGGSQEPRHCNCDTQSVGSNASSNVSSLLNQSSSQTGHYYNPFNVLSREMTSLEKRFKETEKYMRKSLRPKV